MLKKILLRDDGILTSQNNYCHFHMLCLQQKYFLYKNIQSILAIAIIGFVE